jgi:prepilin-type N-terminal cleavage/methylation domain-containing protein
MIMPTSYARSAGGFTLVELMIGMAVGLIMLTAVVALTVSVLRTNAEVVTLSKLTQEGRAIGDLVTREVRRARYSGNYLQFVGSAGSVPNAFETLDILSSGSCVRFAYDANDNGTVDADEVKVISLRDGAVYFGQFGSFSAATCVASGALRISSPDVQVTGFVFSRDAVNNPNRLDLQFRLALANDPSIFRRFDQQVHLRNPFL